MLKFFTKEVSVSYPVPEYVILSVDNFNNWFNRKDNNAIYAHPGIFLRTDKLCVAHVLDYMDVCYGIKSNQASSDYNLYDFYDLIRKDWIEKLNCKSEAEKTIVSCSYCDKYGEAVDRNDLLEKYVEELADAIISDKVTNETKEDAIKYRSKLIRC